MTEQGNFRVIVEPDEPWPRKDATYEKWVSNCNDLIKDIKRHVDGFVDIRWDSDTLCSFCGAEWETETSKNDPDIPYGQPLCCEKAVEEWERQQGEREEQQHEKGK